MKKVRLYNLDLLKIIAMFMVILLHTSGHGIEGEIQVFSFNYFTISFLRALTIIAVNIFVLASSYTNDLFRIRTKRIFKIIVITWFYSIVIYLLLISLNLRVFNFKDLAFSFFPIITKLYWFITIYLAFYLITPYLNKFLSKLSKKEHFSLLIINFLLFSLIPNIVFFNDILSVSSGYSIIWFVNLFIAAKFIKNHFNFEYKNVVNLLLYFIGAIMITLSKIIIDFVTIKMFGQQKGGSLFYSYNSVLTYFASLFLFIYFLNLKINNKHLIKIVKFITPTTLMVYIIHDNKFMREYLWGKLNLALYLNDSYFILIIILVAIAILMISIFIEKGRAVIFDKLMFENKIINKITYKIDNIFELDNKELIASDNNSKTV